ncbi:glycerate kinase type-2 family protein [Candidatus Halobonum tyrrellensis]|uniref:Hydroxypyruvate reductase n=1 Tax=Candidatus Halobonum tyrrellensis G22 TaxID=1324957 RepID=V4GYA9_9EURY|nr:DUF4147 domain-containing protein [Candidatus Halobonum tyrrellensis]ESP90176.1 hydroxypyruvate reductase [Candidatus Halobonum tyrrellensis G22]
MTRIADRDRLASTPERALALDCIETAVEAADPETATLAAVDRDGETLTVGDQRYDLTEYDEVLVVGGGKAAAGATRALESVLGDRLSGGVVVTKEPAAVEGVRNAVGDHPLPSARNAEATADLLARLDAAGERTLALFVLTGGASALLTAPAGDVTVDDLRATTRALLDAGAPIGEVNAVRKHLSAVKGGRVAAAAAPATVASLLVSDVVGDDPSTVGSGPTVPDPTTYADALAVLDRRDLRVPDAVRDHLDAGTEGAFPETPAPDDPAFDRASVHFVADNATALDAARGVAEAAGYEPVVLTSRLRGEAREVAKPIVAVAEEVAASGDPVDPPAVLLAGGECTVSVAGEGTGGPNQEFALSAALELDADATVAAVDTDGEDGSTDAAGGVVDRGTVTDPEAARAALRDSDAGAYLSSVGAAVRTGPTGTNVNDVVVVVVPERPR